MTDDEMKAFFEENEYTYVRKLGDGWAGIFNFMFTWGICTELDMTGYGRRYCYKDKQQAIDELAAMQSLDDVPKGWTRRLPEPFFLTIGGREGQPFIIGQCLTEREIITNARLTSFMDGEEQYLDLENLTDTTVEDALKSINSEGRVLEVFRIPTEIPAFLERAKALGLDHEGEAENVARSVIRW